MFEKMNPVHITTVPGLNFGIIDSTSFAVVCLDSVKKGYRTISKLVYFPISEKEMSKLINFQKVSDVIKGKNLRVVEMDEENVIWKHYEAPEGFIESYREQLNKIENYRENFAKKMAAWVKRA